MGRVGTEGGVGFWVPASDPRWGWVGRWAISITVAGFLLGAPREAATQELRWQGVPSSLREEVRTLWESSETDRFRGDTRIHDGVTAAGNVAVVDGTLRVDGVVEGSVLIQGGDLVFGSGGWVEGDVIVLGGRLRGSADGHVGGTVTVDRVSDAEPSRRSRERRAPSPRREPRDRDRSFRGPEATITARVGPTYNRVEGLPIGLGPRIRTAGATPLELEALAIWRTESGFDADADDLGYSVRLEQRLGRYSGAYLGGHLYSRVQAIEDWGLSNAEASLATLVLHEDYRDYVNVEGWSAFAGVRLFDEEARFGLVYRDERFGSLGVGDPWTLTDRDDPWRPQPLVAEGALRSLGVEVTAGDPDGQDAYRGGWYVHARVQAGLEGTLERPVLDLPGPGTVPATSFEGADLRHGFVDLRRYAPLGPDARLNLRVVAGGALNDRPLPPQWQHAFGGAGSLPGHRLFAADCGARAARGVLVGTGRPAFARYGCDRFALAQVEYRGSVFLDFDWGDDGRRRGPDDWGNWEDWDDESPWVELGFDWSLFFDAGRGWVLDGPGDPAPGRADTDTLMDAGAGIWISDLGLLLAVPLDGDEHPVRFLVRFEHRF